MNDGMMFHYGECPRCKAFCQPENDYDDSETVICCECRITWTLHHEDPHDSRNGEHWRLYRITDIEDFGIFEFYDCEE